MKAQKILIRGPNWIGDSVLSLPAIRALRAHFPDSEITILVRPWVADLFQSASFIDRVWIQPKPKGFMEWWQTAKEIRGKQFDLAILLPNSFESALTAYMAGIPSRVGYSTDGRKLLLTQSIRPTKTKQHQYQYYLDLICKTFGSTEPSNVEMFATPQARADAWLLLEKAGIPAGRNFVAINPGAAFGGAKRWYEERFAAVADLMAERENLAVAIVGSEAELKIGKRVGQLMKHDAAILSGRTSLETLIGLLAEASVMVTNDSGPMHIAAALGTPTVAVFGSTDAEITSPVGTNTKVISKAVACSPCMLRECPIDHRCMDAVTVEEVYASAAQIAAKTA